MQATLRGNADAFVAKLNPAGSGLAYATYLGGNGFDSADGIAVDDAGNAYVTGLTSSADFPTVNPFQAAFGGGSGDAFVVKLNPAGSALVYSTYLGGSHTDYGLAIAVDGGGNAYVTGITKSTNFPTANPFQATLGGRRSGNAFVAKLNAAGSGLVYSTYLGGSSDFDQGGGIAVDAVGNAYVTGMASSADFPTVNPFQAAFGGFDDAFLAKIVAPPASLLASIDSPLSNSTVSGVVPIQGWALSPTGVTGISLLVDGTVIGSATRGLSRPDVAAAFPGFPDDPNGGYTFAWDTRTLPNGNHTLALRLTDAGGAVDLQSRTVTVAN